MKQPVGPGLLLQLFIEREFPTSVVLVNELWVYFICWFYHIIRFLFKAVLFYLFVYRTVDIFFFAVIYGIFPCLLKNKPRVGGEKKASDNFYNFPLKIEKKGYISLSAGNSIQAVRRAGFSIDNMTYIFHDWTGKVVYLLRIEIPSPVFWIWI